MNSLCDSDNGIPTITREDLAHISPLHRFCANELIRAGRLSVIEETAGKAE